MNDYMTIATYADLQTAVTDWLDRTDISSRVTDCIALAEADFRRQLVTVDQEKTITLTGVNPFTLPADFDSGQAVVSTGSPAWPLSPVTLNRFAEFQPGGGQPAYYATDGASLSIWPAPTTSVTLNLSYRGALPPLSNANPSNWLLAAHPDAYLFGSLLQAEFFGWNDERLPMLQTKLQAVIDDINAQANRRRYGGRLAMRSGVYEQAGRAYYAFRR